MQVLSVPVLPHVAEVFGLTKEFVGITEIMSIGMFNVLATVCATFVLMPWKIFETIHQLFTFTFTFSVRITSFVYYLRY